MFRHLSARRLSVERRKQPRAVLGPCPSCSADGGEVITVAARTDHTLYARCDFCMRVWPVAKPRELAAAGEPGRTVGDFPRARPMPARLGWSSVLRRGTRKSSA